MRIGLGAESHFLRTSVLTCPLSKTDKESLIGRQTVHCLKLLVLVGGFPGVVGENLAAQISHILTQSELAVDVDIVHHDILGVLVGNTLGALLKLLAVIFRPPFTQVSVSVELAAFIVKSVGQLMAN